jgi:hypothetical protein
MILLAQLIRKILCQPIIYTPGIQQFLCETVLHVEVACRNEDKRLFISLVETINLTSDQPK